MPNNETPSNWSGAVSRGNVPEFAVAPQPRCYARPESCPERICGDLATHVRRGRWWFDDQYFCAAHALQDDEPLGDERTMRRVRLSIDVLLAGTSMNPTIAQVEALGRLELAIQALGGIVEVQTVSSTFGRYRASPALAGTR